MNNLFIVKVEIIMFIERYIGPPIMLTTQPIMVIIL